jgi:putative endonuclease
MYAPHLLEGRRGERQACLYLMRHGYDILARRYQGRGGELDIVAFDGPELVFVEVKMRTSHDFGEPWEFVDWQKQQRLRRTADEFIVRYDLGQYTFRFDIVSITAPVGGPSEVQLLRDAF